MNNIIEMRSDNIDSLIQQHEFLLVDFWAEWCAPCKDFEKVIYQVAPDYPEFTFAKINIEEQPELAEEFNVRSIPSVMILCKQVIVYADSGALGVTALRELLDQAKALDPHKI